MIKRILAASLLLSICFFSQASVPVEGTLNTTMQCEAYLSKNKKTNPDKLYTQIGASYVLAEINREANPDWYRVEMPENENSLRWVSASCGQVNYEAKTLKHCNPLPGNADSYVLALSWEPAFCETYGYDAGKRECYTLDENSFEQQNLMLHGLWPNQNSCGHHYGFCNGKKPQRHCSYQPLGLNSQIAKALSKYMPSYNSGSCLERHEWNKHGSCQLENVNSYFGRAIDLAKEMNRTAFVNLIREYHGAKVSLQQLQQAIDTSFGEGSYNKIYLGCNQGKLTDIYVTLPSELSNEDSLFELLQKAPDKKGKNACPPMIEISNFIGAVN